MEGDVGVMVNGAGLAMATMDIIKLAGREPANFLDVGGGASQTMVEKGFEIILKDPNVKMVLVNIFGGILRCDVLARGMVEALGKVDLKIPLVVRLEGTNVNEGREILKGSGIRFSVAQNLEDAVRLIREAGDEL
jgi:succinyl-CoA synthetase beta subunit